MRTRARVIELGNQDLPAKEINRKLQEEGFDRIPTVRTIQYILADYWRLTHEERAKDAPLDLFHLDQVGLPTESLPVLLDAAGYFVTGDSDQQLTGRTASWLWWVHNAAPDLEIAGKVAFAEYLAAGSLVEIVYGQESDNRWLIGVLAMRPWSGEEAQAAYSEAVKRGDIPETPDETEFRAGRLLGKMLAMDWVSQ